MLSKFFKLSMTWPAQNRKAGRALDEKYRKDGHLRQTCKNRHFHTLKRRNEDFYGERQTSFHCNQMCDRRTSFGNVTHPRFEALPAVLQFSNGSCLVFLFPSFLYPKIIDCETSPRYHKVLFQVSFIGLTICFFISYLPTVFLHLMWCTHANKDKYD